MKKLHDREMQLLLREKHLARYKKMAAAAETIIALLQMQEDETWKHLVQGMEPPSAVGEEQFLANLVERAASYMGHLKRRNMALTEQVDKLIRRNAEISKELSATLPTNDVYTPIAEIVFSTIENTKY